jgi:subtilisin family serine protease
MQSYLGLIAAAIGCAACVPSLLAADAAGSAAAGLPVNRRVSPLTVIVQLRSAADVHTLISGVDIRAGFGSDRVAELSAELARAGFTSVSLAIDPPPADAALAARVGLDRFVALTSAAAIDTAGVSRRLAAAFPDLLVSAEAEAIMVSHSTPPNDPGYPQQWHMENTGQTIGGVAGLPGADISWPQAVAVMHTPRDVIVAVLDSGVSVSHPDLFGRLVPGWNTTVNPPTTNTDDSHTQSHGTKCAGIIAAARDNAIGVAGVAANAKIMPIKIATNFLASVRWAANGLTRATDSGAKVASMSWGYGAGETDLPFLRTAVEYADDRGVVMIASTGNIPTEPVGYPAAYPQVIAVGATNNRDEMFSATTRGPEMDLVAPGVAIYTTVDQSGNANGYGPEDGTSFAAPIVAGVAAMVLGINPALTPAQVREILLESADDLGVGGIDPVFAHGRINAYAAVREALASLPACRVDLNGNGTPDSGDLFYFLDLYFDAYGPVVEPTVADFDNDGVVGVGDLFAFMDAWFVGC